VRADGSADDAVGRAALLARARQQYRTGSVAEAWATCTELAELSRQADDAATLADAATVIRTMTDATMSGRVHALCVEALARLADSDPLRQARVRAQLAATADPFLMGDEQLETGLTSDDPDTAFFQLQARHAQLLGVAHLRERLLLADAAIDLGVRHGVDEYVCWGRRWRTDAYAVLGNQVDLTSELRAMRPLVERIDQPAWWSLLRRVEASQRLLEGRFADALSLSDEAARLGGPQSESAQLRLVFASSVAELTGHDLEQVEVEVRRVTEGMPYLARGWLCQVLKARGKREEAVALWRSVAPHVRRMPDRAPEWLIATVGHAEMCLWLAETDTAQVLYDLLLPYADLHAIGYASSPYCGPVAYTLGRLAVLLGEVQQGREHLQRALASTEELHALPYQALTHAALTTTKGVATRLGREHAEQALALARRVGMPPTVAAMEALLSTSSTSSAPGGLTGRELEIAGLVAEGLSNAAIGRRLTLSERTVENHVSHILRKLACSSRAGVATWYAGWRSLGRS
jgi:DNA-binding CsgD family transcriptional regulator